MVVNGTSISSQLTGSHLHVRGQNDDCQIDVNQYDDDYMFLEFQKRKRVTPLTSKRLGPHVQYFILREFITNPKFWHIINNDQRSNTLKKEYDEFITRLSKNIQAKFFLETNSRITDHRYLKKNFKNKRNFIAFCVRNILRECPEMYNDHHQILKSLSKIYRRRLPYNTWYYGNCISIYKKKYGSSNYPVERIDEKQYLCFIKDTLL